ncbi:hypothetical protein AX17_005294 [Amanita inopinata Kibby_2008]|nr:hypothetical protein AX17_005294 [Amanita inopinata Kibby_2008]
MLRASLSITRPALFFRPFSTSARAQNANSPLPSSLPQQQQQQRDQHRTEEPGVDGSAEQAVKDSSSRSSTVDANDGRGHPSQTRSADSHTHSQAFSASSPKPASDPPPKNFTSGGDDVQSLSTPNLDEIKQRLREWSEQTAILIRNRADDFTAKSKTTFSQLGAHLNKVTGYEEIEALKRQVVEQEERINATRQAARDAKTAYEQAVLQRSNSQREVNELLQRKSIWTDSDVGRFTTLVRQDHLFEQEEQRAKAAVDETEDAVEREFSQLMRSILARYHEEQVWSDKIRSASTYGSLAALGLNLVVFILAIVIVEPWKRRRLAQTFERKIEELSLENAAMLDANMQEIGKQLAGQTQLLTGVRNELTARVDAVVEMEREKEKSRSELKPVSRPMAAVEIKSPIVPSPRRRELELAAVGTGAFVAGILSCFWLSR